MLHTVWTNSILEDKVRACCSSSLPSPLGLCTTLLTLTLCNRGCTMPLSPFAAAGVVHHPAHPHPPPSVSCTAPLTFPPSAVLLAHSPLPVSQSASFLPLSELESMTPHPYGPSPLLGLCVALIEGQASCGAQSGGKKEGGKRGCVLLCRARLGEVGCTPVVDVDARKQTMR